MFGYFDHLNKSQVLRLIAGAIAYPATLGAVVFAIAALSTTDYDQCVIGGSDVDEHVNYDSYIVTIKLLLVASTALGVLAMLLPQITNNGVVTDENKGFFDTCYTLGSVLLHGVVVSLILSAYAIITTECPLAGPISSNLIKKDNNITYTACFLLVLFAAIGLGSFPASGSLLIRSLKDVKVSLIKGADCVFRLIALSFAMDHIKNDRHEHAKFIGNPSTVTPTEQKSMDAVCKDLIHHMHDKDEGGVFVVFNENTSDIFIIVALIVTSAELLLRLTTKLYFMFMESRDKDPDAKERIWVYCMYILTVTAHVFIGLIIANQVQLSLYDDCEAYNKDRMYRVTIIMLLATLVPSILHMQTMEIEQWYFGRKEDRPDGKSQTGSSFFTSMMY